MRRITRRAFLDTSGKTVAGLCGLAAFPMAAAKVLGANERINLALIGCGGRGRYVARGMAELGARLVYLCDLHPDRIDNTAKFISEVQAEKPKTTKHMQKVFDDKTVDAVVVATPHHWHALPAILACQAGKDVYVEKPHSYCIWESQQMIRAARKYNRIMQVGTQNRSVPYIQKAIEYINSGKLGDIHLVKVFNLKPKRKVFELGNSSAPPAGFDWNAWLGAAPQRPYYESIFENMKWKNFWDFSGGDFLDDGIHQVDIATMLMGNPALPKGVSAAGGKFHYTDDSEMPDLLEVCFHFDNFLMTVEHSCYPEYMRKTSGTIRRKDLLPYWTQNSTRIELYGTKEMMILGRTGGGWVSMVSGGKVVKKQYGRHPDVFHQKDFIESVKSRKLPNADIELVHTSCCMMHMANIAYRLGNITLSFDKAAEKFIDNSRADKYLKRQYRREFAVPESV
ncbi:MAG: Gfo/Idh/MocA family protein [Planctomycetota bacterium]|jgi:predicted dehydrogenase